MESSGISGGMFASLGPGMLGLETPLHHQGNPGNPQNPRTLHHPQMVSSAHLDTGHHQQQCLIKDGGYPYSAKAKSQLTLSDEDDPIVGADDSGGDPKSKNSPWQRMKWTDTMVKLLIMAVFYIGDEGGSDGVDPSGKKKVTGGLLQKKGKWKSVSGAMMEKGFYVSPQQCEDKFNDLNKRYKRVNDILGKGTACNVVENQNLLETMDLFPKMKDEVRKLLNSKHLFFREMCAYHNSCGHGTGAVTAPNAHLSPETAAEPSHVQPQHQLSPPQSAQQQSCFHSQGKAQVGNNLGRPESTGMKLLKVGSGEEDDEDEDDDSDYSEDDYDEDENGVFEVGSKSQSGHGHEDEDENDGKSSRKKARRTAFSIQSQSEAQLMQQISSEVMNIIQDGSRNGWEKKQWMKLKLIQLEEHQVNCQAEACELEKQRLKWVKYSSKKEREMERVKLENERRRLENERLVLLIRQKEFELFHLQQHQQNSTNKRSDPSSITG